MHSEVKCQMKLALQILKFSKTKLTVEVITNPSKLRSKKLIWAASKTDDVILNSDHPERLKLQNEVEVSFNSKQKTTEVKQEQSSFSHSWSTPKANEVSNSQTSSGEIQHQVTWNLVIWSLVHMKLMWSKHVIVPEVSRSWMSWSLLPAVPEVDFCHLPHRKSSKSWVLYAEVTQKALLFQWEVISNIHMQEIIEVQTVPKNWPRWPPHGPIPCSKSVGTLQEPLVSGNLDEVLLDWTLLLQVANELQKGWSLLHTWRSCRS